MSNIYIYFFQISRRMNKNVIEVNLIKDNDEINPDSSMETDNHLTPQNPGTKLFFFFYVVLNL